MYEKCIRCNRLGKDCIPNLYIMEVDEIRDWARKRKEFLGWSNAELAKASGVPKGTIDSNFSKRATASIDVNYSTFAPILRALIRCDSSEMECREESSNGGYSAEEVETIIERGDERVVYLKEQIMRLQKTSDARIKAVIVLGVLLFVTLLLIIIFLIIDKENSGIGFFWRAA